MTKVFRETESKIADSKWIVFIGGSKGSGKHALFKKLINRLRKYTLLAMYQSLKVQKYYETFI